VKGTGDLWDRRLGLWWIAEDTPDRPAVLASPDGGFTYGELAARAHRTVHTLRALGVERGDAVGCLFRNGVDLVTVAYACQEAGWYFLPLNPTLTAGELETIALHSGARAVLAHRELAERVAGAEAPVVRVFASLDELVGDAPSALPPDRHAGSIFVYTSGTTGRPKGIRRPVLADDPGRAANDAAVFGRAFDFVPFAGPHLVSTAMYHGGSHAYTTGALNVGHPLVVMDRFDAGAALQLIDEHRVFSAYMVPTQFHRLLRLPADVRARFDGSSLHSVVHSAAPCPLETKRQMLEWWGPVIWETYGGMEGAATIAKPHRWLEKPGTVGRAVRGIRLAILDDDGNELPPGEVGNIYYATDGPSFEYVGDPETTRAARRGRFFTIGDIGYVDADGYLFVCDRAKDMIITGGVNVYPAEVEAVLLAHPGVEDAAVVGVPDAEWGERVVAVVQPGAGLRPDPVAAGDLVAYCRERLAGYKCPRQVEFRGSLPRTDAGKLAKRALRDELVSGSGASPR